MKIVLRGITKKFGTQTVLDAVDFQVDFSHTLALIGPSGGGKSTLLRLLAGLDTPDSGEIFVNGHSLPRAEEDLRLYRSRTGIVFQAFNLFPHLSALQNVMLPLTEVHKIEASHARERAMDVLNRFSLAEHSGKQPAQLSGGQRQRVAIARALATNPSVLLLDEPTSALDPEMTAEVLDVIAELRESGKPIILITHEMGFARRSADQVAFIANGGVLECAAAGEFFTNPVQAAVRQFLDRILKY
ncbi:MAG: amino acid ABC transporter ATP-binding protein [bacterium]